MEWYKQYRPTALKEVVGQSNAAKQLLSFLKKGTLPHCLLLTGPSGCLHGDTHIYDPVDNSCLTVKERWKARRPFCVFSLDACNRVVKTAALPPIRYSPTRLFRVDTPQQSFVVSYEHQFLSYNRRFLSLKEICEIGFSQVPLLSTSDNALSTLQLNGLHCLQKEANFQFDCLDDFCSYGGQPLDESRIYQDGFPSQDDALEHIRLLSHKDALAYGSEQTTPQSLMDVVLCPNASSNEQSSFSQLHTDGQGHICEHLSDKIFRSHLAGLGSGFSIDTISCRGSERKHPLALNSPVSGSTVTTYTIIKNVQEVDQEEYFDFHVPVFNNYWCGGLFHHNCGKTSIARILRDKLECSDNDFYEMNIADFRGIDTIRDIRNTIHLAPMFGKCRIWLMDEVHQISKDGSDALLKLLEDTPQHAYFILATTEPQKLKATILTRCFRLDLQPLSNEDLETLISTVAEKENFAPSDNVKKKITSVSKGSARKALVLLEQAASFQDEEEQLAAILKGDPEKTAWDLVKSLIYSPGKWKEVKAILEGMSKEEEPESLRRYILSVATTELLKGGGNANRANLIINAFESNWFDSGRAALVSRCWEVCMQK